MRTSVNYSDRVDYHRRSLLGQWSRDIIMTSISNPEVLAICYAQGWCASPNYMTKQEAEAVTSIGTAFSQSNIKTFNEFKYFTSVTTLPNNAFYYCQKLTAITIPSSITTLASVNVFGRSTNLAQVTWNSSAFPYANYGGFGTAVTEYHTDNPNLMIVDGCIYTADGKTLCAVPPGKTSFSFAGTEETIGIHAFRNTSVSGAFVFPSTVDTILDTPFYDAHGVTSIDLSNTQVTVLNSFYRSDATSDLSSFLLPPGLTEISSPLLHANSTSLDSLTIPSTVTTVKGQLAQYRTLTVTLLPTTPPTFNGAQSLNTGRLTAIYVPAESVSAYQGVSRLSNVASIIQAIPQL